MSKDGLLACFYGYKGGSGRSFMLANVAYMLAVSAKKSVLVVDADLEAPGVGDFFANLAPGPYTRRWRESGGLLEVLAKFREDKFVEDLRAALESADFFNARPATDAASDKGYAYLHRLWTAEYDASAYLDFLGPGQIRGEVIGPSYADTIIEADWAEFYRYGGERFFHTFGLILRERYDHVLFDLRTGFSSGAVRAAAVLADKLVIFATPALQSIIGLRDMHLWLKKECEKAFREGLRDAPELPAMAVLTRVERPAAPDAETRGNARVEPSGAARDADDLFHEAFNSCVKRPVIQHVSGLQVEQLMRPKSATPNLAGKELITKIGEIAAWLANADFNANPVFSDIVEDSATVNESPKDRFDELGASKRVDALIESALKLRVVPENIPDADQRKKILQYQEDRVTGEQQVTALREKHRELKLHAAFLFDLRVSKREGPERDWLQTVFDSFPMVPDREESPRKQIPPEPFDLPRTFEDFRPHASTLSDRIERLLNGLETTSGGVDERASTAYLLLANSALRDDREGFERGTDELDRIVERALRMDDGPPRWSSGFQIVWAAHTLRNLGGDRLDIAERWFGQGWRLGALFSSGKPPPPAEANGIVSYAFLFGATGRVKIARTTLEHLKTASEAATQDPNSAGPLIRNQPWWDAVLRMEGDQVASGASGIANGRAPEEPAVGYYLWRTRALRWRGDIDGARKSLDNLLESRRRVSAGDASPRLTRLAELALATQIYQNARDIEALADSLTMAADWAKPPSALFEGVIAAHRASTSLCLALIGREQSDAALAAAFAALGEGAPAAPRLANRNSDDLRWRQPALVRAALTAVREKDDSAPYWLDLSAKALASGPGIGSDSWTCAQRNMWSAEQFYLRARAADAHSKTDTAPAALNNAVQLIAEEDQRVTEAASVTLCRLGDLWLNGLA